MVFNVCFDIFLSFQMTSSTALRFTELDRLPKRMLAPIDGYESLPVVSLEEAVQPLLYIVPKIERNVFIVKQNCHQPKDGLTSNESASIMLYTLESNPHEQSLYVILNATLRSEQRQKLKPWFLYLRLILTALTRLPSEAPVHLSRSERRSTRRVSTRQHLHLVEFFVLHLLHRSARV